MRWFKSHKRQLFSAIPVILLAITGAIISSLLLTGCTSPFTKTLWLLLISTKASQDDSAVHVGYTGLCYLSVTKKQICVQHGSETFQAAVSPINPDTLELAFQFATTSIDKYYTVACLSFFGAGVLAALCMIFKEKRPYHDSRVGRTAAFAFLMCIVSAALAFVALTGFTLATNAIMNSRPSADSGFTVKASPLAQGFHLLFLTLPLVLALIVFFHGLWKPVFGWLRGKHDVEQDAGHYFEPNFDQDPK
jgi:hypothetical protein